MFGQGRMVTGVKLTSMATKVGGVAGTFGRLMPFKSKPTDKQSTGRLAKIGQYLKIIIEDYKMVVVETGQDMKQAPVKTGIIFSLMGAFGYLVAKNPDEKSFQESLRQNANDFSLVGEPIRNPASEKYLRDIEWSYNHGQIRRLSLGVCSLMWKDHYAKGVDLYAAQCKHLKVGWLDLHKHVVDIGVLGRWLWMEKAMVDYDINPEEWK